MNKTIENIIEIGTNPSVEELFGLVNAHIITTLSLHTSDGRCLLAMDVNEFFNGLEAYSFSQKGTSTEYFIPKEDLLSVDTRYETEVDAFYIKCMLKSGIKLTLTIMKVSEMENKIVKEDYQESDLFTLADFFDAVLHGESDYTCIGANMVNIFGMDLKMTMPKVFIYETDNDWKLTINDGISANTLEVSLYDDCCNFFYEKEEDGAKEVVIKPYGQPFTQISLLFFKNVKENPGVENRNETEA